MLVAVLVTVLVAVLVVMFVAVLVAVFVAVLVAVFVAVFVVMLVAVLVVVFVVMRMAAGSLRHPVAVPIDPAAELQAKSPQAQLLVGEGRERPQIGPRRQRLEACGLKVAYPGPRRRTSPTDGPSAAGKRRRGR